MRETLYKARYCGRQSLQPLSELCVLAANEDQLRIGEAAGDLQHRLRALSAEQDQTRRASRVETESRAFGGAVDVHGFIEARPQDHARCRVDALVGMPQRARLRHRFIRAADEMLILPPFYPEMRRKIGEIRQDRHVGNFGQRRLEALIQSPIKVRHQGNDHVGSGLLPMFG